MSPHLRVLRYGVQPEDWQEDFAHENGNYENICTQCGVGFIGHKRRMVCRKCTMEERERWARMDEVERAKLLREREDIMLRWMSENMDKFFGLE